MKPIKKYYDDRGQRKWCMFWETDKYNYWVNRDGKVLRYNKRKKEFREMHPSYADKNYRVLLLEHGKRYFYIHRLVYEMFVGAIPEGYVIDHIDNDPTNNNYKNLQAITNRENVIKYYDEVYWENLFNLHLENIRKSITLEV